ncbi:hypothetical protein [Geobacter sp. AOG2]|uniref:hypothetical protein n=1 Tax=Geobacter sp. AOG2 TaxID=1566347 RepID=UPI001CC76558|nr:hypothetical protein [Geobacter sp. AOG2]GFE59839.1 histidine kinase [Geobacter sp. AOG2]
MSFKKRILAVAAAGVLGALTAVPAMALENEFHGFYKLRYFVSNYEGYNGGPILYGPTPGKPVTSDTTENLQTQNYFEQRARLFYTAKANDDLKLVTGFEIDSMWGDTAQSGTNRNTGGALESDAVNLETKWVYLDFKIPSTPTKVTAGIQPFKDSLKGIFFDFDGAGIMTSTKLSPLTLNLGYIRGYDESYFSTSLPKGQQNLDIGVVEAKMAITKDMNVGAVYYLYADGRGLNGLSNGSVTGVNTTSIMLHTLGLTADAKVGPVALSGFAAYQGGVYRNVTGLGLVSGASAYSNALAYNVAAKAAVGPGSLKTALLFTSGQGDVKSGHLTGWVGTSQSKDRTWSSTTGTSSYNESGMMLLNRNAAAQCGTTDRSIAYNTGNGTNPLDMQGLYLYTLGYDATITPKLYANANLGFAWTAKTNGLKPTDKRTGLRNSSNYMGSEINLETGYKMYDNLTAYVQAAYVVLGGYYKNSLTKGNGSATDPENPYTARVGLTYAF